MDSSIPLSARSSHVSILSQILSQPVSRAFQVHTTSLHKISNDRHPCRLAVKVEAPEPPAGPLSKPSKAHEASSGGNNSAQPSTPGSRLELPPEEGVERSIRESNARQPSDLPIVRKKRTKRPLSGVRKKARTVASAFLRVTRKSPVSSSHPQGRLGDPSKTALHPLPSNLDRTASKLSMDALAKAAALVERGGLASPETGVETAVQPVKRAREELEKDGEGSSGSGDELPISKMGRKIQGGEVTRGKQRERHVEASVPVPRSALAGACGQGTGPKLRVPEVSRRLSTGLSGFTKLPTGPSLIRSAGLSERPRASNRAQLPGEKALPVRPGVSSPVVHDIEAKQRSKPGMGVPVTHNPESKQWSKLGESPWPCGKTELSGQKPGFSKPGESTRGAGWANVGVPSMNVIGRAVSGASQSLPHRLVQRMGTNGVVSQTRECEHAPAEKRVSPAGEKDRNGAPTGKPERLPGSQHPEVPPGKQQLSLAAASSQSGGAPKPSKPPGFHPPGTGAPQIQSAPALRRLPEIPPRRSDVSSTSGAFRAFAGGQPNRMRPSALSGVQPNAGIAGVAQNAPGSMRKGLEEYARLVGQRPGASFGAQDGGGAAEAAANPQMVQFWRRQEVLAKNMR